MQVNFPKSKGPPRIWNPRHLVPRVLFTPSPHSYLFVNLCKLFQVVLKKGNLLLLGVNPPTVLGLHFCTLVKDRKRCSCPEANRSHPDQAKAAHRDQRAAGTQEQEEKVGAGRSPSNDGTHFLDSSRDVLNEQLAKVVEGLEFPGLERMMKHR